MTMPMPAEPCPWCGESDKLVLERTETAAWHIHCKGCFADGPSVREPGQAAARWDARVARRATAETSGARR
jgi:hypothetical protein